MMMKVSFALGTAVPVAWGSDAQWEPVGDAPWQTRGHFGATVSEDGTILIAGGMHTEDNSHLNDVWSSKDGKSWEQQPDAPWEPRHRHGMVHLNGCSYVYGGTTKKNSTDGIAQWNFNDVWKSCDSGASWDSVTKSAQWSPREGFAFTVVKDKMLIIGGTGVGSEVWASADGKDWELLSSNTTSPATPWPARYANTAVTTPQGEVLLAGGFGSATASFKDVWASPDGGRTWEERTAKAEFGKREYVALAATGNRTYLLGGQASTTQLFRSYDDVWVTDDGSAWNKVATMPSGMPARGGMPVLEIQGSLVVLGGSSEIFPHADFNDVWRFTPDATEAVLV